MKFNLPTKEQADEIVAKSEAFYRADRVVEGQNVAIFDYRLASLGDFVDNEAFELRGLTFVQESNGTWKRELLMNKFFNINQCSMDDLWEIELEDGTVLKLDEMQICTLANGKEKFARDLTENDDVVNWDKVTEEQ